MHTDPAVFNVVLDAASHAPRGMIDQERLLATATTGQPPSRGCCARLCAPRRSRKQGSNSRKRISRHRSQKLALVLLPKFSRREPRHAHIAFLSACSVRTLATLLQPDQRGSLHRLAFGRCAPTQIIMSLGRTTLGGHPISFAIAGRSVHVVLWLLVRRLQHARLCSCCRILVRGSGRRSVGHRRRGERGVHRHDILALLCELDGGRRHGRRSSRRGEGGRTERVRRSTYLGREEVGEVPLDEGEDEYVANGRERDEQDDHNRYNCHQVLGDSPEDIDLALSQGVPLHNGAGDHRHEELNVLPHQLQPS
mmetsp:Transcript_10773/g.31237  ORF Transcript_10773/g.31237 Transcript_10773/m.31237 type:complete len:309 (+) Transcript_10773:355-1281(+)